MSRTTVDIDEPILREVKALRDRQGTSLGRVISDLLAQALRDREKNSEKEAFSWISRSMGARVEVADKEALYRLLDQDAPR
jgi:hypothetical protein